MTGLRYFMKFHGYCGTVLLWLWCICSLFLVHQLCMFEQDNCCCCRHTKSAVNVICEISGGWCWLRGCGASVQDIGSLHFILLTTALDNYWQHICWLRAGSWICLNVDNYHSLIKDSSPIEWCKSFVMSPLSPTNIYFDFEDSMMCEKLRKQFIWRCCVCCHLS